MRTLTPVLPSSSGRRCVDVMSSQVMGVLSVEAGKPLGAHGQHVGIENTNHYRLGGFGALGSMPMTKSDTYVMVYKWQRDPIVVHKPGETPREYNQAVSQFFKFWKEQENDPKQVDQIRDLEAQADWRRGTILTYSVASSYVGGARIFDGHLTPNFFDDYGLVVKSLDLETPPAKVKLPMEIRYPEIKIEGRKMEVGLLTSRREVDDSIAAILYRTAEHIATLYGESTVDVVDSNIPKWIESEQLGRINLNPFGGISMVDRRGPNVDFSERVKYNRLVPQRRASLEKLSDLHLYFMANPVVTRLHRGLHNSMEIIGSVPAGKSKLNIIRVNAADFVDQFYFSSDGAIATLNEHAANLRAYRKAQYKERREAVQLARRKRVYRERQQEALDKYVAENQEFLSQHGFKLTVDHLDIDIYGDYMNPEAALTTVIQPNKYKHWGFYRAHFADLHFDYDQMFEDFEKDYLD